MAVETGSTTYFIGTTIYNPKLKHCRYDVVALSKNGATCNWTLKSNYYICKQ